MTTTLYVGNLPWATTEEELIQAFSQYGHVESARIITDRDSGRSRGFGFLEVADEDADRIVSSMNGQIFGGRELTVNVAQHQRR